MCFVFFSYSSVREIEIKNLEEKIDKLEKDIMQKEVMSQGQMFEQWHQYAETLEEVEKKEHELKLLQKKLMELKMQQSRNNE